MSIRLKTILLIYRKSSCKWIPNDIKNMILLEFIINYHGLERGLLYIVKSNRLDWIRYLVEEKGADIHYRNDYAFIQGCSFGQMNTVKYLVGKGAFIQADNNRALICASANGHFQMVKYLVKRGGDIHQYLESPLIEAARYGHLEVIKYLVEQGSDIRSHKEYILYLASQYGYSDITKYLTIQIQYLKKDIICPL